MIRDIYTSIPNAGKRWQLRNRKRYLAYCKKYNRHRKKDPILSKKKQLCNLSYSRRLSIYKRQKWATKRAELLDLLGGKCASCHFADKRALQIDHVYGNGCNDRKKWKNQMTEKAKNMILEDYQLGRLQLLCANCNWIKKYDRHESPTHLKVAA